MIDSEMIGFFTPLCVVVVIMTFCIRYALRGCCETNELDASHYYVDSNSHHCRRLYLDENNRLRSVMIAARVQPGPTNCPQLMGYVLNPALLSSVDMPITPVPPRYEEAIKALAGPPKYEASSGATTPSANTSFPASGATTARLGSTGSTDDNKVQITNTRHHTTTSPAIDTTSTFALQSTSACCQISHVDQLENCRETTEKGAELTEIDRNDYGNSESLSKREEKTINVDVEIVMKNMLAELDQTPPTIENKDQTTESDTASDGEVFVVTSGSDLSTTNAIETDQTTLATELDQTTNKATLEPHDKQKLSAEVKIIDEIQNEKMEAEPETGVIESDFSPEERDTNNLTLQLVEVDETSETQNETPPTSSTYSNPDDVVSAQTPPTLSDDVTNHNTPPTPVYNSAEPSTSLVTTDFWRQPTPNVGDNQNNNTEDYVTDDKMTNNEKDHVANHVTENVNDTVTDNVNDHVTDPGERVNKAENKRVNKHRWSETTVPSIEISGPSEQTSIYFQVVDQISRRFSEPMAKPTIIDLEAGLRSAR